jgi:hypothetical protein
MGRNSAANTNGTHPEDVLASLNGELADPRSRAAGGGRPQRRGTRVERCDTAARTVDQAVTGP